VMGCIYSRAGRPSILPFKAFSIKEKAGEKPQTSTFKLKEIVLFEGTKRR
jgi:hypothetical protein